MKKFEKMYKDYFNNINLSREEKIKMKEKIMGEKKSKFIFKFAYRLSIFIGIFLISGIMIVTANSLVRQFRVNENKNIFLENNKLNIDCNANAFNKDTIYTHEELEKTFEIKILKNSKVNSDLYKLSNLKSNEEKVASIHFSNINSREDTFIENDVSIGFGFKTKYYDETKEDEMDKLGGDIWISGPTEDKEVYYYHIKSLDTEAIILSTRGEYAPILVSFVYDNVVYEMDANKFEHSLEDVYSYLDAYVK